MPTRPFQNLASGYLSEIDAVDEHAWYELLQQFDDANIYQTWAHAAVTSGRQNMSHAVLRKDGEVVAITQVRVARVPLLNVGIAYIRWGPVWRRQASAPDMEIFRQALRALRNEFAVRRGLVLRLVPALFEGDSPSLLAILAEEGFASLGERTHSRTILMDLHPPLEQLREGMKPHWKRELKLAEKKQLTVVEGTGDDLFAALIDIHREMVSRKNFVEGNDINQFRAMQSQLPDPLKMKIMLCKSDAGICAGLVCSAIGKTALYLFGATSNIGMKSNGGFLLHWKLIEQLKQRGHAVYDLNGINPVTNPGTYKFKSDLGGTNGRDVSFVGRFDSPGSAMSRWCVEFGEAFRELRARRALQPIRRTA